MDKKIDLLNKDIYKYAEKLAKKELKKILKNADHEANLVMDNNNNNIKLFEKPHDIATIPEIVADQKKLSIKIKKTNACI